MGYITFTSVSLPSPPTIGLLTCTVFTQVHGRLQRRENCFLAAFPSLVNEMAPRLRPPGRGHVYTWVAKISHFFSGTVQYLKIQPQFYFTVTYSTKIK